MIGNFPKTFNPGKSSLLYISFLIGCFTPIVRVCIEIMSLIVTFSYDLCKRGCSQEGRGAWAPQSESTPPLAPQIKWHFVQGSEKSRHFESRSAPPPTTPIPHTHTHFGPPLAPPHFEKSSYVPVSKLGPMPWLQPWTFLISSQARSCLLPARLVTVSNGSSSSVVIPCFSPIRRSSSPCWWIIIVRDVRL